MKTKYISYIAFTAIITSMLAFAACSEKHTEKENDAHDDHEEEIVFGKEQAEAAGLTTEKATASPFRQVLKTSGRIMAAPGDEVMVVANSNGVISYANNALSDGSEIGKGEAVFSISAKNMLNGDPVDQMRREYETVKNEFDRASKLVKDQIISTKEFEQIRLRYENARAAYQGVASRSNGSGTVVTSPIGGYLKNRLVREGEYVSAGQPVATISQTRRLQLRAEVSERYFDQLAAIQGANFRLPYSDRTYELDKLNGRLLSFGKTSAENSFYVPVTFEFDNVGDIVAGSFAEIYLLSTPRNGVISVPVSALTEEQGVYFVYIRVDEEGFRKQEVTLGQNNGERVEIVRGLAPGDEVVVKGAYQVKLAASSSAIPEGHNH